MVPLATDLKILENYILVEAEGAMQALEANNQNVTTYIKLSETVRVLVLNRRCPGVLQRFPVQTNCSSW